MTAFKYRAARPDGEHVAGVLEAATDAAAARDLSGRGLFALELRAEQPAAASRRALPTPELAAAFAGLAALLEAGMPLDRALAAAEESAGSPLAEAMAGARRRVREGSGLSAALEAEGGMPPLVIGILRAGEAHGRLAQAAGRVAAELEREVEMRAQVRAALAYPLFLSVVGGLSVTIIVTVVVPRFAALLGDLGQALPASTRLLLAVSRALAAHGVALLLLLAAIVIGIARTVRTDAGAAALHRRLLEVPLIGRIRMGLASARVCRALAGLLSTGVPLLAALEHARRAAGDGALADRLARAQQAVSEGDRLAVALKRHEALSPGALRLAHFGEESGRLAELLEKAAHIEEAAAHRSLRALVTLLEPALIVTFALVVAFVAAALLQAVYSVRPAGF
jgi:type II secretory pathway component PulF